MNEQQQAAMRQALKALEVATTPLAKDRQEVLLARDALFRALEQPAIKQGWDVDTLLDKPKQPAQQEPVAWVNANSLQGLTLGYYAYAEIYTDESAGRIPLYTRPQAREPLTDEQINEFFQGMEPNNGFWLSFARAIEAAHGIKVAA